MKEKRKNIVGIAVAVMLMLASMVGAYAVQTSAGKVQVKKLKFETSMGYEMSALLYKPKKASSENKVPAIITCHGMYNNKEMQDINLVELSRRGFAVLAIDMFSHGDSENLKTADALPMGVTEALKVLSTFDYVDTERIGLTGHSMGGLNCDIATQLDNMNEKPLVSALLLNSCFATYSDSQTGNYANIYGARDVGIIAGKYDEFLFKETNRDGTALLAKDFIRSDNAQSFLNFGTDPDGKEQRNENTVYYETINGEKAMRVIYTPAITHPWSHFSKRSAKATIEFFDEALTAPVSIASTDQVWQFKEIFNFIGLLGFAAFACNFAILLTYTSAFSILRQAEPVKVRRLSSDRKKVNAVMAVVSTAFGAVIYLPIVISAKSDKNGKIIFHQNTTFGIGLWAALCGIFLFFGMFVICKWMKQKDPVDLTEVGIKMEKKKTGKTILLALLTVGVTWLWVWIADYFFHTDFRIWVLAAKTFGAGKFLMCVFPYMWLFFLYFLANAMYVNCFNYYESENRKQQRGNTLLQAVVSLLPVAILIILQYTHLFVTGTVLFEKNNAHSMILWLFPMVLLIPAATVIGRKIYKRTKNPYLPAIINTLLVTFITCANTSTWM